MRDSTIWAIDEVAASNLSRALGEVFSDDQIATIAKHMSYHRRGAIDLLVSRVRVHVLGRIQRLISDHSDYRGHEWTAGCRSAEEVVTEAISPERLALSLAPAPTKGQMLRKLLSDAKARSPVGISATVVQPR